ncbi:uncharacterized protein [Zea mays]|uniref:uncharacterized protein n=1 Tax=Zea mays TaxID=4577 RepID=UPI0004DEAD82|nr:uncharacterized protein LOC103633067 [Zea mays]|eukprot:XP_008652970.1 uncharacterized protein LOC103633067 [Zea mays]
MLRGRGRNQATNLTRAGDTRWGSHHKTLCRLQLMWSAVLEVLENVCQDATNLAQRTIATCLLEKMESFEFVLVLHLMIKVLGKTNDLSQCLQKKDQNIIRAIGLVGVTLQKLNEIRHHGWDAIFEEAKDFCLKHNIVVPDMSAEIVRRGCSRGHRGQLVTYYEHLHHEIFNVVLDQVIVEFNNRFAERSTQLLRCVACLDPSNSFANYDEDKLVELAQIYVDDFTEYDCIVLRDQLDTFITEGREDSSFLSCCDLGNLAMKMVKTDRHIVFPLVYRLIELALIFPVATATVERAFSAMKIIKTDLRNKMGDEWMSHCMICYIERDIFASIEDRQIIEHYQAMRTRREQIPKTRNIYIVDESNLSN